jgi:hypothetical protein
MDKPLPVKPRYQTIWVIAKKTDRLSRPTWRGAALARTLKTLDIPPSGVKTEPGLNKRLPQASARDVLLSVPPGLFITLCRYPKAR